ncbi:Bardet-Biedl syndrome 12 protein [Protopterus annectens]|uniref:Bardet-Biedl syndrome 12 protein n=1 Tax=Protopterus annectens TaxID=7888 RepID=UPI001CF996CC|nr:Bardet-Biedl syndrome 12 protein [Protopterus annectens]
MIMIMENLVDSQEFNLKLLDHSNHVGLQQLASLAATGRTLLGPNKSLKFIIDSSTHETAVTCSAFRLLQHLDLTSAAGQLLNETVQAHHSVYKTGTTTLLFLVGAWSEAILECLRRHIPIPVIAAVMSQGLESCIALVQECSVPVKEMIKMDDSGSCNTDTVALSSDDSSQCSTKIQKNSCLLVQSSHAVKEMFSAHIRTGFQSLSPKTDFLPKCYSHLKSSKFPSGLSTSKLNGRNLHIRHSRYFGNAGGKKANELTNLDHPIKSSEDIHKHANISHLAAPLSHGNHHGMKLVVQAYQLQHQNTDAINNVHQTIPLFFIEKVVSVCLPGLSEDHSCAILGYVTLVSVEKATLAKQLQDKCLRILLIHGDLTEKYRHVGFHNPSLKVVSVNVDEVGITSDEEWHTNALKIITQANVNLILVKGSVSDELMKQCFKYNILVLSFVKDCVLQAFAETTGAIPVAYIYQVHEHCVGNGAEVSLWTVANRRMVELHGEVAIVVKTDNISLVTVVLSSPVIPKLQVMEDLFWSCAYRLHHALTDERVLVGGGYTEFLCISHLQKFENLPNFQTEKNSEVEPRYILPWLSELATPYKPIIFESMAGAWNKYLCTVLLRTGHFDSKINAKLAVQYCLTKVCCSNSVPAQLFEKYIHEFEHKDTTDYTGRSTDSSNAFDNVTVKFETWRRALDLVLLILQTDAEILTNCCTTDHLRTEELRNKVNFL